MAEEAHSPSFPILSRLLAGSVGLLLSLELAYRWQGLPGSEPLPLPTYLRDLAHDALARYAPVRAWVVSHPNGALALALFAVAIGLVAYRCWLILWRNQVIARLSGTYFRADDGRFPARAVNLLQEIARRPRGLTFVGLTPHRSLLGWRWKPVYLDELRTVATVVLRQYSEENGGTARRDSNEFESGRVKIWRERASDKESQGTTIVLTGLRPQARDTLRSREIWSGIEQAEAGGTDDERRTMEPPVFHVGRVDATGGLIQKHGGRLNTVPWSGSDKPDQAFAKVVNAVWDEVNGSDPNPKLDRIFDYYLRMVWQLALAVPLPYVEVHPFDMEAREFDHVFRLSNQPKGAAEEIAARRRAPIREATGLNLVTPAKPLGGFEVLFDNLRLSRPLRFRNLPETAHALKQPLMFVGQCREEFEGIPKEFSAGPLSFEAYLLWTPKVAPTEHQGALVRIHGASGTLFDSTFLRYQVAEQTRLRQITCEIFVHEGLDAALNIDRESFNNAHPHSVFITKWLHNALRQLATAQKRLAAEARRSAREEEEEEALGEIQKVALRAWRREVEDSSAKPPRVEFTDAGKREGPKGPAHVYRREEVFRPSNDGDRSRQRPPVPDPVHEEKLRAVAQVLAAFGLLDGLSPRRQEALLQAIYEILATGGR